MEEKYGEVEEMNVCDNLGDHLVGNVYVKVGLRITSPHTCTALDFALYRNQCFFLFPSATFSHSPSMSCPFCSSVMKKTQRRP